MRRLAFFLAFLLASCGDGAQSDREQPGEVPRPPAPFGRNWESVTLMRSLCPPPEPGQPTCQAAFTEWSVDDEGNVSDPDGPGPNRLTEADLIALDANVDTVKNAYGLACTGGAQQGWDRAVSIRFEDGDEGQFYTNDLMTGQVCHRGALSDAKALYERMDQLWFKYHCGCFDNVCVDCEPPSS